MPYKHPELRRALGLCAKCPQPAAPGVTLCPTHRDYYTQYRTSYLLPDGTPDHATYDRIAAVYAARPPVETPPDAPHQIAHCGQWHPVTALPWSCPLCAWTFTQGDLHATV